jgi:surface antigen
MRPRLMRRASVACALLVSLMAGACSITMPLAGLDDEPAAAKTTGSIASAPPAMAFAPVAAKVSGSQKHDPARPMSLKADAPLPAAAASTGSRELSARISRPAPGFPRELGPEDLRRAHGAMGLALDPQGNGKDVAWSNPQSGMKGVIIPSGSPFLKTHEICRAFTASTVMQSGPVRQNGIACRPSGGEWSIREMVKA